MRASRKEDVAMMARVCDALPLISFYWPMVSAQDYEVTAPLHQCHAGLTNTLKHVRGVVPPETATDPLIFFDELRLCGITVGEEVEWLA